MRIGRRNYELQWLAVLFEVLDDDERYVCGISLQDLDRERGGMIDGEEGLAIFDQRAADILAKATEAVESAKSAGVRHVAVEKNEPIFVTLDE